MIAGLERALLASHGHGHNSVNGEPFVLSVIVFLLACLFAFVTYLVVKQSRPDLAGAAAGIILVAGALIALVLLVV